MHRELKPQNVLIDNNGVIKLADFGLARDFDMRAYTLGVVTQLYHAPEVLLGATSFSCAIDIWSIGCIFSEMVTRLPLFKGHSESDSEIEQLFKIFSILSTPTEQTWPGVSHLPRYNSSFPTFPENNLKDSVNELDTLGFDLLQVFITYHFLSTLILTILLFNFNFAENVGLYAVPANQRQSNSQTPVL